MLSWREPNPRISGPISPPSATLAAHGRKLGLSPNRAHSTRTGGRALADHDHSRGTGLTGAAAAPKQPRFPGGVASGPDRCDGALRRGLRPARRSAQVDAELGFLAARRPRVGAHRVRYLSMA